MPDGIVAFEEMACPPTPTTLDDSLVKSKTGNKNPNHRHHHLLHPSTTSSSSAMKIALASGSSKSSNGPSDVASTTMGKQKLEIQIYQNVQLTLI